MMTKEELVASILEISYAFDSICDCGEPGYACRCCNGCGNPYKLCECE